MQTTTSKALLTSINLVYFPIVLVLVTFALLVVYLKNTNGLPADAAENVDVFKYVIYFLTPAGVAASFFVYKQQIAAVDPILSLRDKITRFQTAMLVRAACLEVPGMFGAVCAFITGDLSFLAFTALMVALMVYFRPTAEAICNDLRLSESERAVLTPPDGVI